MSRPKINIPLEDIKGLKTLCFKEHKDQEEIVEYYAQHGIEVSQATVSRRIIELQAQKKLKEEVH
jgi:arginine repressor